MISQLAESNPELLKEFEETKHDAESDSRFVRVSERFPLTAVGDINTYALFTELSRRVLNPHGRAGIIVPTGIATDDTCKDFFGSLNEKKALASLFDFENREKLFPAVDSRYKFCLFTTSNSSIAKTEYAFFLTRDELRYILDPQDVYGSNFPGETFRVLKEKEIKQYGEYRTRRLVLEEWDRLFGEK